MNTESLNQIGVFLLIFVGVINLHYLIRVLRFILKWGFLKYLKWIFLRDFRAMIAMLFFILSAVGYYLNLIATPNYIFYIAITLTPTIALSKGLCPPQVLLLHSFDDKNYPFSRRVIKMLPICNVVSLFPGIKHKLDLSYLVNSVKDRVDDTAVGVGSRIASDSEWRELITHYMDWSELIVLDLSHGRQGLIEELEFIAKQENRLSKTILVCNTYKGNEKIIANSRKILKNKVIFQYDSQQLLKGNQPHPLEALIKKRINSHYAFPLIPSFIKSKDPVKSEVVLFKANIAWEADYYLDSGMFAKRNGKFKEALDFFLKGLAINEQAVNPNDHSYIEIYNVIAITYQELNDLDNGIKYLKKAIENSLKFYNDNDEMLKTLYHNYASILSEKGDFHTALEMLFKSLNLIEKENYNGRLKNKVNNLICTIYQKQGNHELAKRFGPQFYD
jgi:tetratricopeptide (TPR) repeat protein